MDNDAANRLKTVLPHIRVATEMAKIQVPNGKVFLAVGIKRPDGSGQLTADFDAEFLNDVARLLGVFDNPGWSSKPPVT